MDTFPAVLGYLLLTFQLWCSECFFSGVWGGGGGLFLLGLSALLRILDQGDKREKLLSVKRLVVKPVHTPVPSRVWLIILSRLELITSNAIPIK